MLRCFKACRSNNASLRTLLVVKDANLRERIRVPSLSDSLCPFELAYGMHADTAPIITTMWGSAAKVLTEVVVGLKGGGTEVKKLE